MEELFYLLKNSNYDAFILEDFFHAKDEILKSNADLVLMDINIPYLNGELLLKEIRKESSIPILENIDDKYIEKTYKELLYSGSLEDLITIIKTTYLRNDERIKANKKVSDKDKTYFEKAEDYLYNELSVALSMCFDDTKEYIIHKVNELIK